MRKSKTDTNPKFPEVSKKHMIYKYIDYFSKRSDLFIEEEIQVDVHMPKMRFLPG